MKNFAITGVAGFVAPRHLDAIAATGNRLVAAVDPHDSVGILDRYAFDCRYFREFERFDRHLEKLRRGAAAERVHWLTVCSPNYLHDAHIRLALRIGADALCEKPLVISPWNLDALQALEEETQRKVYTVLQLRLHPALVALKQQLATSDRSDHEVDLAYITSRGRWYQASWKGDVERSGGLATNIGIHFFDALAWLFGDVDKSEVHLMEPNRLAGTLTLQRARVRWFLSVNPDDLPQAVRAQQQVTHRTLQIDGSEFEFSGGFTDLHKRVYEETLAGNGFGIDMARPSIELVHRLRSQAIVPASDGLHPLLSR